MAAIKIFKRGKYVDTVIIENDSMFDNGYLDVGEKLPNGRYPVALKFSVSSEELADGVGEELAQKLGG